MDGSGVTTTFLRSVAGGNLGAHLTPLARPRLQTPDLQLSLEILPANQEPQSDGEQDAITVQPELSSSEEIFKQIPMEDLSRFLNELNMSTNLFAFARDIKFDENINWFRVVIRNTETGKVVREIPPWDLSKIIAYIQSEVGKRLDLVV
jgi:uncharacterized FlaG/YvyC family protein